MDNYFDLEKTKLTLINIFKEADIHIINIILIYEAELILGYYISPKSYIRPKINYKYIMNFVNWEKYSIYPDPNNKKQEYNNTRFILSYLNNINKDNYKKYNGTSSVNFINKIHFNNISLINKMLDDKLL